VKLFFFGMSTSFSSGNDFVDNYNFEQRLKAKAGQDAPTTYDAPRGLVERVVAQQRAILENSNLVRVAKYRWGPSMRNLVLVDPGEGRMTDALAATKKRLDEFDALSKEFGFDYTIYLLVPVQDVMRKSYPATLAALASASPRPVVATAQLFLDSPQSYYFAYDGHINAKGNRRIGEFLVAQDGAVSASAHLTPQP
jgi:hypothetical protein